jgi:hypothetical protein
MGTNHVTPDNFQFNAGDIIFISYTKFNFLQEFHKKITFTHLLLKKMLFLIFKF